MKLLRLLALGAVLTLPAFAGTEIKRFKQGDWEDDIGYRQVVRAGNCLYLSGWAESGAMPDAIRKTYDNLVQQLKAHGLTLKDVVKENIYTTDIEALKANLPVRRAYYGKDFPAATWVQVVRLYEPDQVIEVELIAVISEK
ncbi:MAG: 2-iminobutanoate/2-iminopropanoate deaminase [Verrucomicrobiota bacterium]|nr:2-iminobutanoate/2-iminopropanoate deaminase [Verrucomicrobiota bacterium]